MPIQATVILDSGCFLPQPEASKGTYTEIGYFQSSKTVSDIRVIADGNEVEYPEKMNLGKQCGIAVRHVKADGSLKQDGVKASPTFHDELLHMIDLYGEHMPVDRAKFDCIIRFDSGHFFGTMLKPRRFKEHKRQANGKYLHTPDAAVKMITKPIAHNVAVHFKLSKGEALELARDGVVFWSSKDAGARERLDIEIIADNTTAEKFYRIALKGKRDSYWLPNQGEPPPECSQPPCYP